MDINLYYVEFIAYIKELEVIGGYCILMGTVIDSSENLLDFLWVLLSLLEVTAYQIVFLLAKRE